MFSISEYDTLAVVYMASSTPASSANTSITQYYIKLNELNPVANATDGKTTSTTVQPTTGGIQWTSQVLFAPFLISGILFILALGILTAGKFRLSRIGISGFLIALFAASIPTMLMVVRQGNDAIIQASPAETPRNLRIQQHSATSVSVTWDTQGEQPGLVRYSYTQHGNTRTLMAGSIHVKSTTHEVILTDLIPNVELSIEILSGTHWYKNGSNPILFTFKTRGP